MRVWSVGSRVQGSGCRVQGSGLGCKGSGFRVQGASRATRFRRRESVLNLCRRKVNFRRPERAHEHPVGDAVHPAFGHRLLYPRNGLKKKFPRTWSHWPGTFINRVRGKCLVRNGRYPGVASAMRCRRHSYAHALTHSYAHTLTRSHAHTLTHSHTHTLTHSHTPTLPQEALGAPTRSVQVCTALECGR